MSDSDHCHDLELLPKGSKCNRYAAKPARSDYWKSDTTDVQRCVDYATDGGGESDGDKGVKRDELPTRPAGYKLESHSDSLAFWVGTRYDGAPATVPREGPVDTEIALVNHEGQYSHRWTARVTWTWGSGEKETKTLLTAKTSQDETKNFNRALSKAVEWMENNPSQDYREEDQTPEGEPALDVTADDSRIVKPVLTAIYRAARQTRTDSLGGYVEFVCDDGYVELRGVSADNVVMVKTGFSVRGMDVETFEDGAMAISPGNLSSAKGNLKMTERVRLYTEYHESDRHDSGTRLVIEGENGSSVAETYPAPDDADVGSEPTATMPHTVEGVEGDAFKKAVKALGTAAGSDDTVQFGIHNGDAIMIHHTDLDTKRRANLSELGDDVKVSKGDEDAATRYAWGRLREIAYGVPRPASTELDFRFGDEKPIQVDYKIQSSRTDSWGLTRYYLAPRVETDDSKPIDLSQPTEVLEEGETAPTFTAYDTDGKKVTPKLKGDNVVWFFPKHNGCRCSAQAQQFDQLRQKIDVEVYGVATADTDELKEMEEKFDLGVNLLSDPDGDVADAFGVNVTGGLAERHTFFVRDGQVTEHVEGMGAYEVVGEADDETCEFADTRTMALRQCDYNEPELLSHIEHPSVVVITGERGSGKSSTAYHIAEEISQRDGVAPVTVGLPEGKQSELPGNWQTYESIQDTPPNSVVVVDEAYKQFHARRSSSDSAVEMSQLVNLSRHCDRTIVFVSQDSGQLDKNAIGQADALFMKRPAPLQMEFERRQVRELSERAYEAYEQLPENIPHQQYTYVYTREDVGLVETDEASFYGDGLSNSYEGACTASTDEATAEPVEMEQPDGLCLPDSVSDAGETYTVQYAEPTGLTKEYHPEDGVFASIHGDTVTSVTVNAADGKRQAIEKAEEVRDEVLEVL